jgi:hypothetical protein
MKRAVLCGIALMSTATAVAQPPVAPPQTMTLTGCILGGAKSRQIALVNALALPEGTATTPTAPPPPDATPRTSESAATEATVRGTAPAGSSASSVNGYRLSGADMTAWIGRRVQIVGTLVSSPGGSSGTPIGTSGTKNGPLPMPEFRVVSVQPITGACPLK